MVLFCLAMAAAAMVDAVGTPMVERDIRVDHDDCYMRDVDLRKNIFNLFSTCVFCIPPFICFFYFTSCFSFCFRLLF